MNAEPSIRFNPANEAMETRKGKKQKRRHAWVPPDTEISLVGLAFIESETCVKTLGVPPKTAPIPPILLN